MGKKYYVSMTDKFLSGWGMAENKISKYIIICNNLEQAREVAECAGRKDSEFKYINIATKKPYYNSRRYVVSYDVYEDVPRFRYTYHN